MARLPLVIDIETKYTFRDFSDHKKLGVSVAAAYDFASGREAVFEEKELHGLFRLIEGCSFIVGYNINSFDLPVLQAYYPGDITSFKTFDLLEDIREKIGRRLALNDVVNATLGLQKSGHGLLAVEYYNQGKMDELKKYCLDDVLLTKSLFEYGVKHGYINYLNERGKMNIKVSWSGYMEHQAGGQTTSLTLPF